MSEATTKNIGKFITGSEYRDAVHISVAPVLCSEDMMPGAIVKMVAPNVVALDPGEDNAIGILDPYIKSPIPKGTWVYVFMYMNTIHDLHHEWNHPAFSEKVPVKVDKAKAMKSWEELEKGLSSLKTIKWSEPAAPLGTAKTKVVGEWVDKLLSVPMTDKLNEVDKTHISTKSLKHEAQHKAKEAIGAEEKDNSFISCRTMWIGKDYEDECKNCY